MAKAARKAKKYWTPQQEAQVIEAAVMLKMAQPELKYAQLMTQAQMCLPEEDRQTTGAFFNLTALRNKREKLIEDEVGRARKDTPAVEPAPESVTGESVTTPVTPIMLKSIDELDLPIRASNCLISENVYRIGELVQLTRHEMKKFPNVGDKSIDAIEEALKAHGLKLGMKVEMPQDDLPPISGPTNPAAKPQSEKSSFVGFDMSSVIDGPVKAIVSEFEKRLTQEMGEVGARLSNQFEAYMTENFRRGAISAAIQVQSETADYLEQQAVKARKHAEELRKTLESLDGVHQKVEQPQTPSTNGAEKHSMNLNGRELSGMDLGRPGEPSDWKPRVGFVDTSARGKQNMDMIFGDYAKVMDVRLVTGTHNGVKKKVGTYDVLVKSPFTDQSIWEVASRYTTAKVKYQGGVGDLKRAVGDFYEMRVKGHTTKPTEDMMSH